MDEITVKIDGKEVTVPKGTTILKAARKLGIKIPTFCYHDGLSIAANCRMCLVETNKSPKLLPACHATVMEGMEVKTNSERVKKAREGVLEFILTHHPVDCPICDQAGECDLQDNYEEYSLVPSEHEFKKIHKDKAVPIGPYVMLDAERCILCTRCIRFNNEVVKAPQLTIVNRGIHSSVATFPGEELNHRYSLCTVDLCPVGALTSRDFRFKKRVWFLKHKNSICTQCGRGCNVRVDFDEGIIYRLVPVYNEKINKWWACDEGRLSYKKFQNSPNLFQEYELNGSNADENEIYKYIVEALKNISDFGVVISPELSCEDIFYIYKLFKEHFKVENFYQVRKPDGYEDDILIVKDKHPNSVGLKVITSHFGVDLKEEKDLQADISQGSVKRVLMFLPEADISEELVETVKEKGTEIVFFGLFKNRVFSVAKGRVPIRTYFERRQTFVNIDGFIQQTEKVLSPKKGIHSPWVHAKNIARISGIDGFKTTVSEVYEELETTVLAFKGAEDVGGLKKIKLDNI